LVFLQFVKEVLNKFLLNVSYSLFPLNLTYDKYFFYPIILARVYVKYWLYEPLNFGSRFSIKDCIPSLASSVAKVTLLILSISAKDAASSNSK
jgi:hypothetical protein